MKNRLVMSVTLSIVLAVILSCLFFIGFLSSFNVQLSDRLYTEKQPLSNIVIVGIDDKSLQEIGRWPWPRSRFAEFIEKTQDARVIGIDVSFFETSQNDTILASVISSNPNIVLVSEYTKFSTENGKVYGTELLKPIFNARYGFANVFTDADGITRSFPTDIEGTEKMKAFAVAVAETYTKEVMTLDKNEMLINFFTKPGGFATVSFSDVINNRTDVNFTNKIVLVGATAVDLHDTKLTPISSNREMAGIEVHANIIQTILTRQYLDYQGKTETILFIFIFSMIAGLLFYRTRLIIATPAIVVIAIIYLFYVVTQFDKGIIMNIIYPVLSLIFVYVANIGVFYVTEKRQRTLVTNIFGKYVSKEVANEILKKATHHEVALKGEKREISVLFSDIRSFTSMSEKMQPEELVSFLNKYFTKMTDAIVENRGVVDKYIGDAIMAFWGAPLDEKNHAKLAVSAALGMRESAKEMNVRTGIGINTGLTIVGSIGSTHRVDYTAIGDTVNAASRLEGLNKEYGTSIIIGEATYEQAGDDFVCRELDMIKVKGKNQPIRIYEVVAKKGEETPEDIKLMEEFATGLNFYRNGQWNKAVSTFKSCLKIRDDGACRVFIERCDILQKQKPDDWDGVWTMTKK